MATPSCFGRSNIGDDAAAGVGAFTNTYSGDIRGKAELLNCNAKAITASRKNEIAPSHVILKCNMLEVIRLKVLRVNDSAGDMAKDLEFAWRETQVISEAR
jgi:hypothetical protein